MPPKRAPRGAAMAERNAQRAVEGDPYAWLKTCGILVPNERLARQRKDENEWLSAEVRRLETENRELAARVEWLKPQLEKAMRNASLDGVRERERADQLDALNAALQDNVESLTRQLVDAQRSVRTAQKEADASAAAADSARRELSDAEAQYDRHLARLESKQQQRERSNAASREELDGARERIAQLESELSAARASLQRHDANERTLWTGEVAARVHAHIVGAFREQFDRFDESFASAKDVRLHEVLESDDACAHEALQRALDELGVDEAVVRAIKEAKTRRFAIAHPHGALPLASLEAQIDARDDRAHMLRAARRLLGD